MAAGLLRRVVDRGVAPPLHPDSERILLKDLGLLDRCRPNQTQGDISLQLIRGSNAELGPGSFGQFQSAPDPNPDLGLAIESDAIRRFCDWLGRNFPEAARWTSAQVNTQTHPTAGSIGGGAQCRIDVCIPVDGNSHVAVVIEERSEPGKVRLDSGGDQLLRDSGIEVFKVRESEVQAGRGPDLQLIADRLVESDVVGHLPQIVYAPIEVHRMVLALCEGIAGGILQGPCWSIRVDGGSTALARALVPYLDLLLGFDQIWGLAIAPELICLGSREEQLTLERTAEGYRDSASAGPMYEDLVVRLEPLLGPRESLPAIGECPQIVVRSAKISTQLFGGPEAQIPIIPELALDESAAEWGLSQLLRGIFAKANFRPGQLDALQEILGGNDCVVLQHTGAGKSLIYQLAGFCVPGPVLIVDPIIALMEDQVRSLRSVGVDRAERISGHTTQMELTIPIINSVRAGQIRFVFVSPERLQIDAFRQALRSLATSVNPVALAVIDESHCVSEWGHDFRPAYLGIGRLIRSVCRSNEDPALPLLALTGTASKPVLKDMLHQLAIDPRRENAIIRTENFDRPELEFCVLAALPAKSEDALAEAFERVPQVFGQEPAEFFALGPEACPGIVYCPHVNGKFGMIQISDLVRKSTGAAVQIYSGKRPKEFEGEDWNSQKRANADKFMRDELNILVATKAFGMGIDKPNVRFVVHYGLPSSIESYYQEVGRAGRDHRRSLCLLILVEADRERNSRVLAPDASLEHERNPGGNLRGERDDISRQFFFHFNSFRGVESELADIEKTLREIPNLGRSGRCRIPFWRNKPTQEKSIHRLVILGVVEEYLVDWGSSELDLQLAEIDSRAVVEHLVEYVRRSHPGNAARIQAKAQSMAEGQLNDATLGCSRILIESVYEFIESSRRRSLREMLLAARAGVDDPEKLRGQILAYLTRGDIAAALEKLADSEEFMPASWIVGLGRIGEEESWELRGGAGRLLSSMPDHPGLLMARAHAELLDPAGDLQDLAYNLHASLVAATRRFGVQASDLDLIADWVLRACEGRSPGTATAAALALRAAPLSAGKRTGIRRRALRSKRVEIGVRSLALCDTLDGCTATLRAARALAEDVVR